MEPLRIGLVGCGSIARRHAQALAALDTADLVAIVDVETTIMDTFVSEHIPDASRPLFFTDQDAFYRESALDGVVIATPHTLHFEHVNRALGAGCHVMVEKPMVTSVDHAYTLRDRATQLGRLLLIGYNTPCTPTFQRLRQTVRSNRLGALELVTGYLTQPWIRLTAGRGWRCEPALAGGGQAYDSGAHLLNSLIWTVESSPTEVYAMLDRKGLPVDVNSVMVARFASGVLATMTISGNCPSASSSMTFVFSEGRVDIDGWEGRWMRAFDSDGPLKELSGEGAATPTVLNLVGAMRGEQEPVTSADDGIRQSELMDAVYRSAESGRPISPGVRTGRSS